VKVKKKLKQTKVVKNIENIYMPTIKELNANLEQEDHKMYIEKI
jgi:hypothetical protein